MKTIIGTNVFPVCPSEGAKNETKSMAIITRTLSPHRNRSNSNCSEQESVSSDYSFIPSSASSASLFPPSTTSCRESFNGNVSDQEDDAEYFSQFLCPTDSDDEQCYDSDNDDVYMDDHLARKQLVSLDYLEERNCQRAKRANKKMSAHRQIKTKQAKSIKIKSHNKSLYIHHRLAKKVILDEPSYHCIPSPSPKPLYSPEELRLLVYQYRYPYTSSYIYDTTTQSRKPRHQRNSNDTYVDESRTNLAAYQFRDYTLHEYNIPDEPSYDDAMVNFLLDMQNRDLSPEDYEMLLRLDERVQRKTISSNILDTLPTIEVDEKHLDEQCTICMETYNLGQELKLLPCTHIFHSSCIETYLKDFSIQCPLDNLPLI